jgi:endonuclease/exonuclease/phosphatase (EEP) superfamily protein YafD
VSGKKIRLWRGVMGVLGVACPLGLLLFALGLRFVGERWWATTAAMYLPRGYLALPAAAITLGLVIWGPRRLLLAQLVSAAVLLFPILGLTFSRPPAPTPGAPHLRLVSHNVASGNYGWAEVVEEIAAYQPDIVLMQETGAKVNEALHAKFPGFSYRADGQFTIASRYPVIDFQEAPPIGWPLAYARYRLDTPAGPIRVYNVHAMTPHRVLEDMLGKGLRHQIMSGRVFDNPAAGDLEANAAQRLAELRAVADDAASSPEPVIIAGDTNSPGLSWGFATVMSKFQDGFAAAGNGLGYTYPALKRTWMRIDRVLAAAPFRFLTFEVMNKGSSDHRGVVADLELAPPR